MENYNNKPQQGYMGELVLGIIFIIYLILGLKTPEPIASLIDTLVGKIVIFIIVVYMFLYTNSILAVLSLFVAFDLIRRSSMATGIDALQKFLPTEETKSSQFTSLNQFPYTLEQEVVKKMVPIIQSGSTLSKASYTPLVEDYHDASNIN
jgi:hypothetical protein